MKRNGRKAAALLVTLGFLATLLAAPAPAGAPAGRDAPNFSATIQFTDDQGGHGNSTGLNRPENITANVSIAPGQPNVTNLNLRLTIGAAQYGIDQSMGPLSAGSFAEFTWLWIPDTYGDSVIELLAFNSSDHANHTVATAFFRVLSSDITVASVGLSRGGALIGVDEVNITARLDNAGNLDGRANLSFKLDGNMLLGYVECTVVAGGWADSVLATTFDGLAIPDGNHSVTVAMRDLADSTRTSSAIALTNPVPDVQITSVGVDPAIIQVGKGSEVGVNITAFLKNAGTAPALDFLVNFYDDMVRLGEVPVNISMGPGTTGEATFTWVVTDSVIRGRHTLAAGVGDEDMGKGHRMTADLTIEGLADVGIDGLIVSPAAELEGTRVLFTAKLFNNGTRDAEGLTLEFWDGTVSIGAKGNISVQEGQMMDVQFEWLLPEVTQDTPRNITARVGGASRSVTVTVKDRSPRIDILQFNVPDGLRIDDNVTLTCIVKNTGTGDAQGMVVEYFDSGTRVAQSAPFLLTVGSSRDVPVDLKISGEPDEDHLFSVKVPGAEKNVTRAVGHRLSPASVVIDSFGVKPSKRENMPKDTEQGYVLSITLRNTGETRCSNCSLRISEGGKTIATDNIVLEAGKNLSKTYIWKVKGAGDHRAVATLSGADAAAASPKEVRCNLKYTPGFEVLALVAAIMVAIAMARRHRV